VEEGEGEEEDDDGGGDAHSVSDESSIMMYSPLMPTTSSLVELAETEFMPVSVESGGEEGSPASIAIEDEGNDMLTPTQSTAIAPAPAPASASTPVPSPSSAALWMDMWPFNAWGPKGEDMNVDPQGNVKAEKKDKETMTDPDPVGVPCTESQPIAGPSRLPLEVTEASISAPPPPATVTNGKRPKFRVRGQLVWVPSTTKLSFEARWWGYRMFVPFIR
jgi:hypothetical protein